MNGSELNGLYDSEKSYSPFWRGREALPYMIATPRYSNRPMYYEGRATNTSWVIDPVFGKHARNVDAKLFFLIRMGELVAGKAYEDGFIVKYFKYFQNTKTAKVVREGTTNASAEGG